MVPCKRGQETTLKSRAVAPIPLLTWPAVRCATARRAKLEQDESCCLFLEKANPWQHGDAKPVPYLGFPERVERPPKGDTQTCRSRSLVYR